MLTVAPRDYVDDKELVYCTALPFVTHPSPDFEGFPQYTFVQSVWAIWSDKSTILRKQLILKSDRVDKQMSRPYKLRYKLNGNFYPYTARQTPHPPPRSRRRAPICNHRRDAHPLINLTTCDVFEWLFHRSTVPFNCLVFREWYVYSVVAGVSP